MVRGVREESVGGRRWVLVVCGVWWLWIVDGVDGAWGVYAAGGVWYVVVRWCVVCGMWLLGGKRCVHVCGWCVTCSG